MSWIKDNQFSVVLGGATLAGAVVLFIIGSKGSGRYAEALESYQEASQQTESYERLALYPSVPNRDGKSKALAEYRQSVQELQQAFSKFRPAELPEVSPQDFTTGLIAANEKVRKEMEASNTILPEGFFLGFEPYANSLARQSATGLLNYQLDAIEEAMLALAKAAPTEIRNLHRPRLSEEGGTAWQAPADAVSRPLPFEVTFKGSEESMREFLSALSNSENYYYVIRSLRIANEKQSPPLVSDARFETAQAGGGAGAPASDPFGGAFVIPDDDAGDEEEVAEDAAEEEAPAAEPAAASDSSRILTQVLGTEEVQVFLRIDVLQFLPVKQLPQP